MAAAARTLAAALALALAAAAARAGEASLTDPEFAHLKKLVESEPAATMIVEPIRKEATRAVHEHPHPVKSILTEGKLAGDPDKVATQKALEDMPKIQALAFEWRLGGDRKFLAALEHFLTAWAEKNEPNGDPIDDTNLEPLIEAYDLARRDFAHEARAAVDRWLKAVAAAEIASRKPGKGTAVNNWNSHRLKIVGLIAFALGDEPFERWAEHGFEEQIAENLRPDGSSYDFEERDALHYHCYDIEPLLRLAIVLARAGKTPYTHKASSGASLERAVAFLLPYARGEKTHHEYVHSKVEFDRQRAANDQPEFQIGHPFDRHGARFALELAEFFEPHLHGLTGELYEAKGSLYPSLRVLLNDAMRRSHGGR